MKRIIIIILIVLSSIYYFKNNKTNNQVNGYVISKDKKVVFIQDKKNIIHTFKNLDVNIGDNVLIEHENNLIINYEVINSNDNKIPDNWLDDGIFSQYYNLAYKKLQTLSIDEKIGQLLIVRYNKQNDIENLKKYNFGGYVFYEKDFKNKTKEEVKNMINNLQNNSKIPLITSVDEEGGKVVRISSNPNLSNKKFQSPQELYNNGGLEAIKQDTIDKIKILSELGINLNLAPVVDVSLNSTDYMYERSLGQSTEITCQFSKTVITTSKNSKVTFTLKHFPGYGNNIDTHTGIAIDNRNYEDILKNDIPPFKAGINAGAEVVLISHNTVTNIDNTQASLSYKIHNILRDDLSFTGIIITDDLSMGATNNVENATTKALLAGNDILIVTDYEKSINEIKQAINNNFIDEKLIDKLCFRILSWKYYKGLI